jgi:hypothetical protein
MPDDLRDLGTTIISAILGMIHRHDCRNHPAMMFVMITSITDMPPYSASAPFLNRPAPASRTSPSQTKGP